MGALYGLLNGIPIIEIALDHLDTLFLQDLSLRFRWVAGDCADMELFGKLGVIEDKVDRRSALVACSSKDDKEFAHRDW